MKHSKYKLKVWLTASEHQFIQQREGIVRVRENTYTYTGRRRYSVKHFEQYEYALQTKPKEEKQ